MGLLADYQYGLLHYFGEDGVQRVEGAGRLTASDQGMDRHDPDDHSGQHSGF
jgi:hypothetical protein